MRITLALGLQYDSDARQGHLTPLMQSSVTLPDAPASGVIEIDSYQNGAVAVCEFNRKQGIYFLTYNLHGMPEPLPLFASRVDLFT